MRDFENRAIRSLPESVKHNLLTVAPISLHPMLLATYKARFTWECKQDANTTFENDANVRCKRVTEVRQTAFGCAMNVWRTAKCHMSTVGTSKGIRMQYVYVWSIRGLNKY